MRSNRRNSRHTIWDSDGAIVEYHDNVNLDNTAHIDALLRVLPAIVNDILTSRQKELLYYRYYKRLSFLEIAKIFKVNPSTVSRIHKQTLVKLKAYLRYCDIAITCREQLMEEDK